jgi:recombination protein RecA
VTKNKVAAPFRVAEFDIMYDEGISRAGDLLDIAVDKGLIEKRGSYYYRDDENLAQGRENAKQFLRDHSDVAGEIEAAIRESLISQDGLVPASDDEFEGGNDALDE